MSRLAPPERRTLLAALLVAGVFVLSRAPLHRATHGLPVSNDDAIPLLMARQLLKGELSTILWNQPYNGALDAYLLAPGLAVAPHHAVFRAYEAACALTLAGLVAALAGLLAGRGAALAAALLAAVGTPYMMLMAATGPTPNFLVPLLVGAVAVALQARVAGYHSERPGLALALGVVSGLASWDSMLALPPLAGAVAGTIVARARVARGEAAAFAAGAVLGLSPLAVARAVGASGSSSVTALRPRWLWGDGLADLLHAARGLFGFDVALVVDGPEREALPLVLRVGLVLAGGAALALGARSRRSLPLVGWALALAAAFALSRRTGADELRYLYGLVVPVLALAGAGLARAWATVPTFGAAAALALLVPWWWGEAALVRHWRDPQHAVKVWQVPPVEPVLETLRRAPAQSAYASLQFAARLTLESGGAVIASQAWNERIPGDPLRFRDEVDLDPKAAWVLSPHLSRGMPRAAAFRSLLQQIGGSCREDLPGDFVVFRACRPPYDESRPVPAAELRVETLAGAPLPAAVLDRNPDTGWTAPTGITRGSGLVVKLAQDRRLSALVLAVGTGPSPLAVPWVAEADGAVASRGPVRHALQWVNGAPRAGKQALLAVTLGDQPAAEVHVVFQGAGPPLQVAEVFAYGPDEPVTPAAGASLAADALAHARAGRWDEALAGYREALRAEPDRASNHAAVMRTAWRAAHRFRLDVESLDDGGEDLIGVR